MNSTQNTEMSAQFVQRFGYYAFVTMTSLLLICIAFGFYAVIDKATGKVAGRQTLMRIDAANGSIEIGNIYWGPLIARQRGATEALFSRLNMYLTTLDIAVLNGSVTTIICLPNSLLRGLGFSMKACSANT